LVPKGVIKGVLYPCSREAYWLTFRHPVKRPREGLDHNT